MIETSPDIEFLSNLYIQNGIIPKKKVADALHVAITVVNQLDILLSWNYQHLANISRERKILAMNELHNYHHQIRIVTPLELMDYDYEY